MIGGKLTLVWVGALGLVIAVVERLPTFMSAVVYAAALIGAVKVLGGAVRTGFRRLGEIHDAVTSDLPDRMERVEARQVVIEDRLEDGEHHFERIDASLETMANVDRARVQGWAEAARVPRPARATDPDPDEDRRVYSFAPWDEDAR